VSRARYISGGGYRFRIGNMDSIALS